MSAQGNLEEQVRNATEAFEEQFDYENPFAGLGKPQEEDDTSNPSAEVVVSPIPVKSQSKPQSALPEDTDEEDEPSIGAQSKGKRAEAATASKQKRSSKKDHQTIKSSSSRPLEAATGTIANPPAEPSKKQGKQKAVAPALVSEGDGKGGESADGKRVSKSIPPPTDPVSAPARRSSELSPFALTQSRMRGVVQQPGHSPAGVRIGGVSSPPASDAASIAGRREDDEDALDDSLGDPEDLMDVLTNKPKTAVKPGPVKRHDPAPAHKRGMSVLSAGSPSGGETVVANSHEIRIMALEKQVASLLDQNKALVEHNNTLADKTDALIKELAKIRQDMIAEINEKLRRVGGPPPVVTVTTPSPISPAPSAPVPQNVVSSPTVTSPSAAAADPSISSLTGEALKRYLRRQRRQ